MSPERAGVGLYKEVCRQRINKEVSRRASDDPKFGNYVRTLQSHLDELPIPWDKQNRPELQHTILTRVLGSFGFSYRELHGDFPPDSVFATEETLWKEMQSIVKIPKAREVFLDKLSKLPVSFVPRRAKSAAIVINRFFGDTPVTAVDLGASFGYMLPAMTMPNVMESYPFADARANELYNTHKDVQIGHGVSVDILSQPEAIEQAKAKYFEAKRKQIDNFLQTVDPEKFSFVQADITQKEYCLARIQEQLKVKSGDSKADVITTYFSRYQFPGIFGIDALEDLIVQLLKPGGIWIDVGVALGYSHSTIHTEHTVDVFKNSHSGIDYNGPQFSINDEGEITDLGFES